MTSLDDSPIDLEEIDLQTTIASDWVQLEEEPPLLSLHDLENLEIQASEGVGGIASSSHSYSLRLLVNDFLLICLVVFCKFLEAYASGSM